MVSLAGPFFMFATLLVLSGIPKLTRPEGTARALAAVGFPARRNLGRAVGVAEIIVGASALVFGGPITAAAMALLYTGFAAFIMVALRSEKAKSCGCFGSDDTPPSLVHLGVDVAAAAVAVMLVVRPIGDLVTTMGETPWAGFPLLLLILIGTWLALLVLALMPAVFNQART